MTGLESTWRILEGGDRTLTHGAGEAVANSVESAREATTAAAAVQARYDQKILLGTAIGPGLLFKFYVTITASDKRGEGGVGTVASGVSDTGRKMLRYTQNLPDEGVANGGMSVGAQLDSNGGATFRFDQKQLGVRFVGALSKAELVAKLPSIETDAADVTFQLSVQVEPLMRVIARTLASNPRSVQMIMTGNTILIGTLAAFLLLMVGGVVIGPGIAAAGAAAGGADVMVLGSGGSVALGGFALAGA
jgi:hypothetical protein